MKITKISYIAYDKNKMYIGSFEDEEYAQKWADKHGGYIDRHLVEREENRIYDDLLKDITSKETAKKIFEELLAYIGSNQKFCIVDDKRITLIDCDKLFNFIGKLAKHYRIEVNE